MHKLMVKTHNTTGLKYLCYTQKENHSDYLGSGKYWKRHLKLHGADITTELIFESDNYEDFVREAIARSKEWSVVEDSLWANLKIEDGVGGDTVSTKCWITDGVVDKYHPKSDPIPHGWYRGRSNCKFKDPEFQAEMSRRGHKKITPEIRKQAAVKATATKRERNSFPDISGDKNPSKREDVKQKIRDAAKKRDLQVYSEAAKKRASIKFKCPHCGVEANDNNAKRWHFERCKHASDSSSKAQ